MRWPAVLAAAGIAAVAACGTEDIGPFESLPLDGSFEADVTQPVQVARDHDGIAHVHARTLADAAFVQGYVMAHDRLPQMDVLRHLAAGTLAELYGAADPSVIDGDLVRRLFRNRALATASWATLQASSDPTDQELVRLLTRFSDGVNAYARALRAGDWTLDPAIAASCDPAHVDDWSPIDSLAIARWWTLAQSFTVPFELDATRLYQQLRTFYDESADISRRGISRDLWKLLPIGTAPTLDGFFTATPPATSGPARPTVPAALLTTARDFFAHGDTAFQSPRLGGHAFAVDSGAGAGAMLAAAIDLPLTNPALLYPTHLIVEPIPDNQDSVLGGDDAMPTTELPLDLIGATLPGVPGVVLGANLDLAWASTASLDDTNDVYLEQIAPCPTAAGDCDTQHVPLELDDEAIQIGTLGAITDTLHVRYERVTGHGPLIPALDPTKHTLATRADGPALAFRAVTDEPTFELRTWLKLARARTTDDALASIADTGGQSWVFVDHTGARAWTPGARRPLRPAAATAWDPLVNQDALSPLFVLPGTGEADWLPGQAPSPDEPIANQPAIIVAANADPLGATVDGKPFDQATADGAPLYLGADYDIGVRQDRIAAQLGVSTPLSVDGFAAISTDTRSSLGERFAPILLAALDRLDRQLVGPPDVNPYLDALSPGDLAQLSRARALLQAWTFATPVGPPIEPSVNGQGDSAATALFHTWLHFFVERSIKDELDAIGLDVWRLDDNAVLRVIYAMLHDPNSFVTSPTTQQPILCDNYAVSGPDDSCTKGILEAMVDAMSYLAAGLGEDPSQWAWGTLHQITLAPWPGGGEALRIPSDGSKLPRPGDAATVERGNPGWSDLDFAARPRGSAYRLIARAVPSPGSGPTFELRAALAGGTIFDTRSPHSRDQLDRGYLTGQPLPLATTFAQIVAAGETRWVFH